MAAVFAQQERNVRRHHGSTVGTWPAASDTHDSHAWPLESGPKPAVRVRFGSGARMAQDPSAPADTKRLVAAIITWSRNMSGNWIG